MTTQTEEQQAKDFLKRAEIRTMRKDLSVLRESDSLKERDKIAKIKTLDEQEAEHQKALAERTKQQMEKLGREAVLEKNENQEYAAEKELKNDATEVERQQIFLFESQRVGFEKQIEAIDKQKEPALQLQKNQLLLQTQDWQKKLAVIVGAEKKLQDEEKTIIETEQHSTIPAERKGLEQRKGDLDKEIQETEKKRWAIEKQIEALANNIKEIDKGSEQNTLEKNSLKDKILGIDKSLREIYSVIITRIEEKRRQQSAEQLAQRAAIEKAHAEQNARIQRQQYSGQPAPAAKGILPMAPQSVQEKMAKMAEIEAEERKKFLEEVKQGTEKKDGASDNKNNVKK